MFSHHRATATAILTASGAAHATLPATAFPVPVSIEAGTGDGRRVTYRCRRELIPRNGSVRIDIGCCIP
jgi:hypothetical protein